MAFDRERLDRLRHGVLAADPARGPELVAEIDALFAEVHRPQPNSGGLAEAQADALVNSAMMFSELEAAKDRLEEEVQGREQAEAMIRAVVEGTSIGTGQEFLRLLTQHLSQALGMSFAFVGQVLHPGRDRIQVLASWANGAPGPIFAYDLDGTPCAQACQGELCYYPDQVQQQFPDDKMLGEMGVRSYLGAPLMDSTGTKTLGVIAVLDECPMEHADLSVSILEVFAVRAATELERILFESEMRAARETAELASQAKSRFLAKMSHEIRTPLNGVLGTADILSATSLEKDQIELVKIMQEAGSCLLEIVNDVLDLSKIEAGGLQIHEEPFDLRSQTRNVVQLLRPPAAAKGLEIQLCIAPVVPERVLGDSMRVRQILTNLIGNAVRYTDFGSVDVAVTATEQDGELVVRFEVRDTGPGISEADQERIFSSFEQVDAIARHAGGTGLGLSIARQLAEAMGGAIGVNSQLGAGSVFWANLPLAATEEPQSSPAAKGEHLVPAVTLWPGLRVLVAEDNRVNQVVAKRLLSQLGCVVEVVPDGSAAICSVRSTTFDIVFMDSQMPGVDGLDATRVIREELSKQDLPIISLTANAFEEHREACLAVGMNDVLNKPMRVADVQRILGKWAPGVEERPATARVPPGS